MLDRLALWCYTRWVCFNLRRMANRRPAEFLVALHAICLARLNPGLALKCVLGADNQEFGVTEAANALIAKFETMPTLSVTIIAEAVEAEMSRRGISVKHVIDGGSETLH